MDDMTGVNGNARKGEHETSRYVEVAGELVAAPALGLKPELFHAFTGTFVPDGFDYPNVHRAATTDDLRHEEEEEEEREEARQEEAAVKQFGTPVPGEPQSPVSSGLRLNAGGGDGLSVLPDKQDAHHEHGEEKMDEVGSVEAVNPPAMTTGPDEHQREQQMDEERPEPHFVSVVYREATPVHHDVSVRYVGRATPVHHDVSVRYVEQPKPEPRVVRVRYVEQPKPETPSIGSPKQPNFRKGPAAAEEAAENLASRGGRSAERAPNRASLAEDKRTPRETSRTDLPEVLPLDQDVTNRGNEVNED